MDNLTDCLADYDDWVEERAELSEREPEVRPSEWQDSDDTAFTLLNRFAHLARTIA